MVRSVLLTQGLSHRRAKLLVNNPAFRAMMHTLIDGKRSINILFCEDGAPYTWKETEEHCRENPGSTTLAFWQAIFKKIAPTVTVNLVSFSFRCPAAEHPRAKSLLQAADIFYCKGTGRDRNICLDTHEYLVNISEDPFCAELVLA